MNTPICTALATLLLGTVSMGACAAEPRNDTPFYAGGSMGGSSFSVPSPSIPAPAGGEKADKRGTAFKVYGGYRLTENFGVEAGYARLGRVSQWASVNGRPTLQSGSGNAIYGAATAHWPLGDSFALNGRLGLARGKVSGGDSQTPAGQKISGNATGVMAGFGAEYRMSSNIALTADYDHFGKLSKHAKAGMLTVGLRASF